MMEYQHHQHFLES
jgi:hypothetical protein